MYRGKTALRIIRSLPRAASLGGAMLAPSTNLLRNASREAAMPRIISAIPLILCLGLPPAGTWAQDDATDPAGTAEPAATEAATSAPSSAEGTVNLQDNVPSRYVVVKGDTLWGISERFLKNPWKWPDLWGINKDVVRNPHWIYPGDVLILDLSGATPRLRLEGAPDGGTSRWMGFELQVSQLRPQIRSEPLSALPIPTIPAKILDPFLTRSLVVEPAQITAAPVIVANIDKRVVVSAGDMAYVTGLDPRKGKQWQVFRQGRVFQDPDTKEVLGFEAVYLGDADVTGFGEVSTVQIVSARQEIAKGDRLAVVPPLQTTPYIPRAPDRSIRARVIAGSDSTVNEMGTYSVVVLNRGRRDGLEVGHVLGLYRSEGSISLGDDKLVSLPEQRYGLLLVFRTFEKMAFGVVMNSRRPVNVRDVVRNP